MRDQGVIYAGLAVFLGLITFPVSYNLAAGKTSRPPDLKMPAEAKQCVAPADYMRRSHMDLLIDWRDLVVRDGVRTYKKFEISLTNTCMKQCHTSKEEFCDRCHSYVGVSGPYCMDCHQPLPYGRGSVTEPRASASGSITEPRASASGSITEPRPSASGSITEPRPSASGSITEPRASASGSVAEARR